MSLATLDIWSADPLPANVAAALQRLRRVPGVRRVAAMPDVHLAHDVCIGTVLGAHERLFPLAVGGDIGCGVATLRFTQGQPSGTAAPITEPQAERLFAGLERLVPGLRHPKASAPTLPPELLAMPMSHPRLETLRSREAGPWLGTLGRGNHFLELQLDHRGQLWAMVHSGSRGLGPAIRDHHLRGGTGPLRGLNASSPLGQAYLQDQRFARAFARANRERMMAAVAALLAHVLGVRPEPDTWLDCDHNHVEVTRFEDGPLWVHRKGAIPAGPDQPGLIPGSMGTATVHTLGRGCERALHSSSHGAGRCMSRSEARRRVTQADLARQLGPVHVDPRRAEALLEEAPQVYKDLDKVMRAQRSLTRVLRRLRPVLCYRAGRHGMGEARGGRA